MGIALAWILAAAGIALAPGSTAVAQDSVQPERPRLVVLVVVDQLFPEQLERLDPWLTGGLGRFLREGLVHPRAELLHGTTETGPGHATLGTGCHPAGHGIIGNEWWGDDAGARTYCVRDAEARPVTSSGVREEREYAAWRVSARQLRRPAFADHLRAAVPQAKCVSIAGKDRSAILMAGRQADAVLWWDQREGGFLSSTGWGPALPPWVVDWNLGWRQRVEEGPLGKAWESSLPSGFARSATSPDEQAGEGTLGGRSTFPYLLSPERKPLEVYRTPLQDLLVLDLARAAVEALELGADEHPDLLALSLSACDILGHEFGPSSCETTDLLLRIDVALGELFAALDERVGRERWMAVLGSDHGVLELPELLAAQGIDARRVPADQVRQTLAAARAQASERFGADYVAAADARGVRLSRQAMRSAGVAPGEVRAELAHALMRHGGAWIERAWTYEQLDAAAREGVAAGVAGGALLTLEGRGFDAERSPDVLIHSRPWLLHGRKSGTSHGSPHGYDRSVPLCFLGPGFEAGRSYAPATSADVLPTVLARLGLPVPPGLDGRVLE